VLGFLELKNRKRTLWLLFRLCRNRIFSRRYRYRCRFFTFQLRQSGFEGCNFLLSILILAGYQSKCNNSHHPRTSLHQHSYYRFYLFLPLIWSKSSSTSSKSFSAFSFASSTTFWPMDLASVVKGVSFPSTKSFNNV